MIAFLYFLGAVIISGAIGTISKNEAYGWLVFGIFTILFALVVESMKYVK